MKENYKKTRKFPFVHVQRKQEWMGNKDKMRMKKWENVDWQFWVIATLLHFIQNIHHFYKNKIYGNETDIGKK